MPKPLLDEFVRRRNTLNADTEILDWALKVDAEWADGGLFADTEPGDAYSFWKARYAEKWPVVGSTQKSGCAPVRMHNSPSVDAILKRDREWELQQEERLRKQAEGAS